MDSSRSPLAGSYAGADLPPTVRRLGAASFFQDVASEMVYPLLPGFLAALGGGPALLGAMESGAEGVLALLKGWAGRASDRLGRRKPFVASGYGLSAATRPLLALALATWQVVGLRLLDRVAKGLRTAPRDALIAAAAPSERRAYAFAFHRGLDHLGAALGPLAAALVLWLAPGDLRLVFLLATLPAALGFLTVALGLPPERATPRRVASGAAPSPSAAPLPTRLRASLAAFFLFALGNASDAFLLLRAADLGASAIGLTLLWSGFHAVKWLASVPGGRLADRLGRRRAIGFGWAIYAAVYLGFAFAPTIAWFLPLLAAYALFYGLTEGAERALVVELAGGRTGAGSALGAYHLTTGLGAFLASFAFGALWQWAGARVAFVSGAAIAGGATLLLIAAGRSAARP